MNVADYEKAGAVAAKAREAARSRDWVGKTVLEICERVEGDIRKGGAACAFPVNASINEVAAHYTAEPGDGLTVEEGDLVKIDLGAHVDGHIADTAVTVNYDPRYDELVEAAEEALAAAMEAAAAGVKASAVGRAIHGAIKRHGFKPIANLSGHSLDRYTIHAGRSIPNTWSLTSFSLSDTTAYACEPFVTTGDGLGYVREGKARNIYAVSGRKRTGTPEADRMLDSIWERFNMLPFALRWLVGEWEEAEARRLLDVLVSKKAVRAYPVLVEANGKRVAQAEHTFIPGSSGARITTAAA